MRRDLKRRLESTLPGGVMRTVGKYRALAHVLRHFGGRHPRLCPICRFEGLFHGLGAPFRFDCMCPRCQSVERHRQHHLLTERSPQWIDGAELLHFSPEPCFVANYTSRASRYVRADYFAGPSEVRVDIKTMQFPDESFDTIICHQIMEHIDDDEAALRELRRVLRPDGVLLLSTPIVETWKETYEDHSVKDAWQRDLYFGQTDHVRWYGRDFRDRIRAAGFDYKEDVATEPSVSRYGLLRGETIFIATKAAN